MKDWLPLCLLVGLGGALLALVACGLLLDIPASTGVARISRMNELEGLLVSSAPTHVYVPATLLLLADLRPRLTIKLRRRAGLGDTACPLRLP
jgi:hypothetical protein